MKSLAKYLGWNPDISIGALKRKGFRVKSAEQPAKEVAEDNGVEIGVVIDAMRD